MRANSLMDPAYFLLAGHLGETQNTYFARSRGHFPPAARCIAFSSLLHGGNCTPSVRTQLSYKMDTPASDLKCPAVQGDS